MPRAWTPTRHRTLTTAESLTRLQRQRKGAPITNRQVRTVQVKMTTQVAVTARIERERDHVELQLQCGVARHGNPGSEDMNVIAKEGGTATGAWSSLPLLPPGKFVSPTISK